MTVPLDEIARDQIGKPISLSVDDVAAAGIDDDALDAARLQRGGDEIADHAVGVVGGAAEHDDVAGLALLDGDMHHPVVAGLRQDGDGGSGDRSAPAQIGRI